MWYRNDEFVIGPGLDYVFNQCSLCRECHIYYAHTWPHPTSRHYFYINPVTGDFHPPMPYSFNQGWLVSTAPHFPAGSILIQSRFSCTSLQLFTTMPRKFEIFRDFVHHRYTKFAKHTNLSLVNKSKFSQMLQKTFLTFCHIVCGIVLTDAQTKW